MIKQQINRNWDFFEGTNDLWFVGGALNSKTVDLPHDFIITMPRSPDAAGGPSNGFFGEGQGTYTKVFDLPKGWSNKQVILDIDGAYMNTEVWLNGQLLAKHPYGYTPFLVNLTDALKEKNNKLRIVTQSRQPSTRWYSGGGLYRSVSLWSGGSVYINPWDVFVTTPVAEREKAVVNANITVTSVLEKTFDAQITCTVLDRNGNAVATEESSIVDAYEKGVIDIALTVEKPDLWDLESPNLYQLKTEIKVEDEITDESIVTFGVRKIEVSAKTGFLLNGRELKLKGGCIHHDNGQLGACAYPRAEERKIEILQKAGFNAVRSSHYPPSLAMLEACDRKGMLMMDEAFDAWRINKIPLDYHLYFEDWWERDISYMVLRDRNHPCVISYSTGNEILERDGSSGGPKWSKRLADKVRSLDNTRFVTSALCDLWSNSEETELPSAEEADNQNSDTDKYNWAKRTEKYCEPLDIVGYNYLYHRYAADGIRYPRRVIWGAETHASNAYDYWHALLENKHVIGDFTWVAYDNLGEAGVGRTVWGSTDLPDFFGEYPWRSCYQGDHDLCGFRLPQSYYREILWGDRKEPSLFTTHPKYYGQDFAGTGSHWYDVLDSWTFDREFLGKPVPVQVYGDGDEAEFLLNGVSLGRAPIERLIANMDIPYAPGTVEAIVYAKGKEWGRTSLVTTGEPAAVRVLADRTEITADSLDLCHIVIEVVDENGRRIPADESKLVCAVSAPGVLVGFGSGNPKSEDLFGECWCHAFEGRALAVIKATKSGTIQLMITGEGLTATLLSISATSK